MYYRDTPLANQEIKLHDNTDVYIMGWVNNAALMKNNEKYKDIFDKYFETHGESDDFDNVLVGTEMKSKELTLVHISDIMGYVKETT